VGIKNQAKQTISYEGHKMDLYHTNPYKTGTVECDKCGKDIDVSKGFYHGSIYKVDSHIECVNEESKEDYNVR